MNIYLVYSSTNGVEIIGAYDSFEVAFRVMGEASYTDGGYLHIVKLPLNESTQGVQVAGYNEGEIWESDHDL